MIRIANGSSGRLREDDPALFRAVNKLKGQGILSEDRDRKEYETISRYEQTVRDILSIDDCRLVSMAEQGFYKIAFMDDLDDGMPANCLQAHFTTKEMVVYIACYALYTERYAMEGKYVHTTLDEILHKIEELGLSLGQGKQKRALVEAVRTLRSYSILTEYREGREDLAISFAVNLGLDRFAVTEMYDNVIRPWLEEKGEDLEEDEDDD